MFTAVKVGARRSLQVDEESVYDSAVRQKPLRGAIADLYRRRALVKLLIARDLTVRYKRSLLGVTWTVLNPLLTTLVMWVVFSHLFHAKTPGHVPYIVYLLAGLLVVTYFQQGVTQTASSITASANLLTKVYVPPVVFAFSAACGGGIGFCFGLVPLFIFQLTLGVGISWTIIAVPLALLCLLAMIAGVGLIIAAYSIRFDDVLYFVNVSLVLVGYLTPTFYPITIIPLRYRKLFYLNPLYSYVNVFRYLEYGGPHPVWANYLIMAASGSVGFAIGLAVFVRRWPRLVVLL